MISNAAITDTSRDAAMASRPSGEAAMGAATSKAARERGQTYIDDEVISVIARMPAEQVDGVHKIGEWSLRGVLARVGKSPGVGAEVGLKQAAVDVEIAVEFGFSITDITARMREQIIESVESMTGRQVVEVNIFVIEVHVPKTDSRRRRTLE